MLSNTFEVLINVFCLNLDEKLVDDSTLGVFFKGNLILLDKSAKKHGFVYYQNVGEHSIL